MIEEEWEDWRHIDAIHDCNATLDVIHVGGLTIQSIFLPRSQKERRGSSVLFEDMVTDNEVLAFDDDKQDPPSQSSGRVLVPATPLSIPFISSLVITIPSSSPSSSSPSEGVVEPSFIRQSRRAKKPSRVVESQRRRGLEAEAAREAVQAKAKAKKRKVRKSKLLRTSQIFDSFVDPSQEYELVIRSS